MLEAITIQEVRQIANLAKEARVIRDRALSELPERELGEEKPQRGEHNPAAGIGFAPLPADHPARTALQKAVAALSDEAGSELLAVAWIGRGEYGAKDWQRAVPAAAAMLASTGKDFLADEVDLHEQLIKGLYELSAR
jgi:hypothetical protein